MKTRHAIAFVIAEGLYTVFVLQQLWNWFVAPAIHADSVSYWQMLGIGMFLYTVVERDTFDDEQRWEGLAKMVRFCVSASANEQVTKMADGKIKGIPKEFAWHYFGRAVGTRTPLLVVGWLIHTFLTSAPL